MIFLAKACIPLLIGGIPTFQAKPPRVGFTPVPGRALITVNNPEQLFNVDLGDSSLGNVAIYRSTVGPGQYRDWYEHTNRTGNTIGYGIAIFNPNTTNISVTYHGKGFTTGFQGGKPFSDMFANYSNTGTTTVLAPGARFWLWRNDSSAANTNFFSGVIDFDIAGGSANVENIAYRTFNNLTGTLPYQGYIQRIETDGTHCARQYKGISPYSEVRTSPANFSIGDSDAGALDVASFNYSFRPGRINSPVIRNYWFTNIGPGQNEHAIVSDMLAWDMPGWGMINPLTKSDGEGKYPNLGNWGVMYSFIGSVTNRGSVTRNLSINLKAPNGGGSPIAYRGNDGVWRELKINAGSNIQYYTFSVAPGQTQAFDAKYILGGPGAGSLTNTITVNNAVPSH